MTVFRVKSQADTVTHTFCINLHFAAVRVHGSYLTKARFITDIARNTDRDIQLTIGSKA